MSIFLIVLLAALYFPIGPILSMKDKKIWKF